MALSRWVIDRAGRRVLEVRLGGRITRIGSDPSNDIVLEGDDVPPLAAVITLDDAGRAWARVLGSRSPSPEAVEVPPDGSFALGSYVLRRAAARAEAVAVQATRRIDAEGSRAQRLRLRLPEGPRELAPDGAATLGRDEGNDVVVDADVISGFHCRLYVDQGAWHVGDLGSTNGTFLEGVRVTTARLPARGTLTLGDLPIPFESAEEVASTPSFHGLVGRSPSMQALFRQIEVVAALEEPVLILGETGTGKELVAGALHAASPRRARRFVARNCGAIPETLADAELFGSRKGAFSGAIDKAGVFEWAEGGTVFLDEIGELPIPVQPKLLRALQEKRVQRLGELADKPVQFRLVAATHRDLRAMVAEGRFREDLYHRVGVFTLEVPPLRARREDIPLLAEHLLEGSGTTLTDDARAAVSAHDWPGNVRELRNVLIRASAFRVGPAITAADLRLEVGVHPMSPPTPRRRERRTVSLDDDAVRALTWEVWEETGRSVSRAAERLGIAKSTMHRRKEVYGLPEPDDL